MSAYAIYDIVKDQKSQFDVNTNPPSIETDQETCP